MFLNEDLLESLGLDEVVPQSLAAWRPLVAEGVGFFLEHLPPHRLAAIVAGQMSLPADAGAAKRLVSVLAHCPTLHKLGQVLARHRQLPLELRQHLQSLESMPPAESLEPVLDRIREEIGDEPAIELADQALAEGSVAVVVPFTYREAGEIHHGVFKVLKPEVETRLAEELSVMTELASFLEKWGRELGLPPLDYRGNLESVEGLLLKEIRLEVEQANLRAAGAFYAREPRVLVPRLLPWCTARVTAMERVMGAKVTETHLGAKERQALAQTMVAALLAQPFWSQEDEALFHGDLHGGNLLVTEDGRLAILDWSLTARLSREHREALVAIAVGGLTLDAKKICRSITALGSGQVDESILGVVVEEALNRLVMEGKPPGFHWLLGLLDNLAGRISIGFQEDFAVFRKSWLSLSGVIRDLAGEISPDLQLINVGLRQFIAELPRRWLATPRHQQFSTHVSNADLMGIWASSWLIPARYWARLGKLRRLSNP